MDNRINQKNQRIVCSLVFVYINNKCAIGATIKSEIIVRSINMTNNSNKFTGIDDARISPPTSDKYINCVTEIVATMNLVICD